MAYDRDFNHQAELFSDDEFHAAMDELVANSEEAIAIIQRFYQRGCLGQDQLIKELKELRESLESQAEDRMEMLREERRAGECA